MVRPPSGLYVRKYRKKPQIVPSTARAMYFIHRRLKLFTREPLQIKIDAKQQETPRCGLSLYIPLQSLMTNQQFLMEMAKKAAYLHD